MKRDCIIDTLPDDFFFHTLLVLLFKLVWEVLDEIVVLLMHGWRLQTI